MASLITEISKTKRNGPMADAGSIGEIIEIESSTAVTKKKILK
jgi:hypothetical protein